MTKCDIIYFELSLQNLKWVKKLVFLSFSPKLAISLSWLDSWNPFLQKTVYIYIDLMNKLRECFTDAMLQVYSPLKEHQEIGAAPKSSIFRKTTIFGRKIPPKTSSFAKDTTFGCAKLVSFSKLLFLDAQN